MPKVTHTSQSEFKAHSLCMTPWLSTASHDLPILIFHCLPVHPLLSILTHLLNGPHMPCALPLAVFTGHSQFWDPLHLLKSSVPQCCAVSTVSPKFMFLPVAANKHFYCYLMSVALSAFLHLVSPPFRPLKLCALVF